MQLPSSDLSSQWMAAGSRMSNCSKLHHKPCHQHTLSTSPKTLTVHCWVFNHPELLLYYSGTSDNGRDDLSVKDTLQRTFAVGLTHLEPPRRVQPPYKGQCRGWPKVSFIRRLHCRQQAFFCLSLLYAWGSSMICRDWLKGLSSLHWLVWYNSLRGAYW